MRTQRAYKSWWFRSHCATGIGSSLDLESFRRDSEVLGRLRGAERFGRVPAVHRAEAKSGRELGIQPEPPGEPRVERQDGTPPQQFFRGRDDEDTAVFLREVQENPSLRELEEPFVEPRREPEVDEGVPCESVADHRAAQEPAWNRHLPEVPEEVVEG